MPTMTDSRTLLEQLCAGEAAAATPHEDEEEDDDGFGAAPSNFHTGSKRKPPHDLEEGSFGVGGEEEYDYTQPQTQFSS